MGMDKVNEVKIKSDNLVNNTQSKKSPAKVKYNIFSGLKLKAYIKDMKKFLELKMDSIDNELKKEQTKLERELENKQLNETLEKEKSDFYKKLYDPNS